MAAFVDELGVLAVRCFGGCFAWLGVLDVGVCFSHVFDWRLDTGAIADATVVVRICIYFVRLHKSPNHDSEFAWRSRCKGKRLSRIIQQRSCLTTQPVVAQRTTGRLPESTNPNPERVSQQRSLSNTFGVHRQSTTKPGCAARPGALLLKSFGLSFRV